MTDTNDDNSVNRRQLAIEGIALNNSVAGPLSMEQLRKSEEKYRNIFESMEDAYYEATIEGKLIDISPSIHKLSKGQYTREALIGASIIDFYTVPEQRKAFFDELFAKGSVSDFELSLTVKPGMTIPVAVSSTFICDESGNPVRVIGNMRDISERKSAELLLRASEDKYSKIFRTSPNAIIITRAEDGKIIEVNEAFTRISGYSQEEAVSDSSIGLNFWVNPNDRTEVLSILQEGKEVLGLERKFRIKDGGIIYGIFSAAVIYLDNKPYVLSSINDISDRKTVEKALRESEASLRTLNATKDKFFSIIAHDLRSPFSGILGLTEMLREEARTLDVDDIENFAVMINNGARQTMLLLENLLDWARLQQKKVVFTPKNVPLREKADEAIRIMAENARQKDIRILNRIPGDLIVMADEDILATVICNLTSNAVKFTNHGGTVDISASVSGGEVAVSVSDKGIGIAPENTGKLFDIGSGYTKRGTDNEKGTGLGLILCSEFIEQQGVTIKVESEEGKGSTFTFTLPAKKD
jgi:PAS domain S-box-containing protein